MDLSSEAALTGADTMDVSEWPEANRWRPTIADTQFVSVANKLFDICNQIESLNQLNHNRDNAAQIRLPRLALLGNQSVGKSSLVEVISGVTLPRSMGTCTRGPIDITTRRRGNEELASGWPAWYARVTLKLKSMPGHPVAFGDLITDPRMVSGRIRRASLALREQVQTDTDQFLHASEEELDALEDQPSRPTFFTDRIAVEVVGDSMPPLRFTDLPGLVHNAEEKDIETIKAMIESETSDPECLIVLTVSLAVDIATQSAFRLAAKMDPHGARTIGVFTMPDRMQSDSGREWAPVIEGRGKGLVKLQHGWYVVRCPSPSERCATLADSRKAERRFFSQTCGAFSDLCSQLDAQFGQTRCGIDRLTAFLSQLLLSRLREMIPACHVSVDSIMHLKQTELDRTGTEVVDFDASAVLSQILSTFTAAFERRGPVADLDAQIKEAILRTSPRMIPYTEKESSSSGVLDAYKETPWSFCSLKDMAGCNTKTRGHGDDPKDKAMYLDQIRSSLESAGPDYLHRLLNLNGDFEQDIRRRFLDVSVDCFRKIRAQLTQDLSATIKSVFQDYEDLGLQVHKIVLACLGRHLRIEEERIKASINCRTASDDLSTADSWAEEELDRFRKARLYAIMTNGDLRQDDMRVKTEAVLRALAEFGIEPCAPAEEGTTKAEPPSIPTGKSDAGTRLRTAKTAPFATISQFLPDHPRYFSAELRAMALMRSTYNLLASNLYDELRKARNGVLGQTHQDILRRLSWELSGQKSSEDLCRLYFSDVDKQNQMVKETRQKLQHEMEIVAEMRQCLMDIDAESSGHSSQCKAVSTSQARTSGDGEEQGASLRLKRARSVLSDNGSMHAEQSEATVVSKKASVRHFLSL